MPFIMTMSLAFTLIFFTTISPAWAQNGSGGTMGSLVQFAPLLLLVVIFYYFIIRPQNKRMQAHKSMVASLRRGDVVITAGGVIGKIHRVIDDSECIVEIADNIRVRMVKTTITAKHSAEDSIKDSGKDSGGDARSASSPPPSNKK